MFCMFQPRSVFAMRGPINSNVVSKSFLRFGRLFRYKIEQHSALNMQGK